MARDKLPKPEDDNDRAILGDIKRVGWSVLQINPDDEDDEPLYSFTVGLIQSFDHPEVILIGLPHAAAGAIINSIGDFIAGGKRIIKGREYDDFASVPLVFANVDPEHYEEYVGYALWLNGGSDFPILQCVWPLKSGHFPWDDGYDPDGAAIQPLLE